MKKIISLLVAALLAVSCFAFAGCTQQPADGADQPGQSGGADQPEQSGDTLKIGMLAPLTGEVAEYGVAVANGVRLYVKEYNAAGGMNGTPIELVEYDEEGDPAKAVTGYNSLVDQGVAAIIGDVTTGPTVAVVVESQADNMPMITASATAAAVTVDPDTGAVYENMFRSCFIDPFQGEKMAQYAKEKLGYTKAAVIVQTGNDYAAGLNEAFKAKCAELGMTVVAEEGYAKGDKDFNAQLTNIKAADPEFIFCPNYYEDDGMIVKQARALGLTVPFLGGDGWYGVVKYASAEELEGTFYCSAYAPGSTDAVKAFEEAYTAAYGTDTLNMFAANAYDAAMVMCAALAKAEETGEAPASDAYKQAVIDAIKTEGANVVGITSEAGYTFDANNNPIKDAVIMTITNGEAVYKETF